MRPAFNLAAKFTLAASLLIVLTFSSKASTQNSQSGTQDAAQAPCGGAAGATTAQGGSPSQGNPSLSDSAKNLENAAKQLGSIFKKKPAASPTAAAPSPCAPAATNAGVTEPAPASGASTANAAAAAATSPSPAPQAPASGSGLEGAQLPPAPHGGLDPSKLPDIVGVHIGTPTEKAIAQLNALYPLVRNERGTQIWGQGSPGSPASYAKYASTNDPPFISSVLFTRAFPEGCVKPDQWGSCQAHDEIRGIFSGPPEKVLVRLERSVSWEGGRQTTSDNLKAALTQKYGANFTESPRFTLRWAFDEEGRSLPAPKPNVTCLGILSQQGLPAPNVYAIPNLVGFGSDPVTQQQLTSIMRNSCPYILVQVQINGAASGTANQMTVVIQELPQDLRNSFAAERYMRQAANGQANEQLKKAQQQAAPKF